MEGECNYKYINIKGSGSYQPNNLALGSSHIAYLRNIDASHKVTVYDRSLIEKGDQKSFTFIEKDLSYLSFIRYIPFGGKDCLVFGYNNGCQIKDASGNRVEGLV